MELALILGLYTSRDYVVLLPCGIHLMVIGVHT